MATLAPTLPPARTAPRVVDGQRRIALALLLLACAALAVFLLAPLTAILVKSVEDGSGAFVGLAHFRDYFASPSLVESARNTLFVAALVTLITVPLAFTFAYALTRSCMPAKGLFRLIALTPILAPSMLAAISFIQWFGNQGALKGLLMGKSVYGPIGIVISSIYAIFPHALMIVLTALLLADRRLY
jgi:iron(III) transport system permease protein